MRPATFDTVCSFDPGIDTTQLTVEQMGRFTEDRDITKIQHAFRPEMAPTIYVIREIPHALWKLVQSLSSDAERFERAFRYGVAEVRNYYQKDGVSIPKWSGGETLETRGEQRDVISESELQSFAPAEVQEIGAVAYFHSFLHRRMKSCFQQPRSCRQILAGLAFRLAESTPTEPAPSSASTSE